MLDYIPNLISSLNGGEIALTCIIAGILVSFIKDIINAPFVDHQENDFYD